MLVIDMYALLSDTKYYARSLTLAGRFRRDVP